MFGIVDPDHSIVKVIIFERNVVRVSDVCGMCSGSNCPKPVINIKLQNVATYWSRVNGVSAVEVMGGGRRRRRKPSFMVANL